MQKAIQVSSFECIVTIAHLSYAARFFPVVEECQVLPQAAPALAARLSFPLGFPLEGSLSWA